MAVRVWTFFLILCFKASYIIAQAPELTPSGSIHSCENGALTFSCAASGASFWRLTGFDGVTTTATSAIDLSASSRISTSDVTRASNPSNITIMNLTTDDTGGTVQCEDFISQVRSTVSTITVGLPICDINITIEDIAVDSVAVIWVVTSCTAQPTEYEVVWSEVGSEVQSGTSGRISSSSYTVDNLACSENYTIIVFLYNECGVGSNSSISSLTSPPICDINITIEDIAVDSVAVSWVVTSCTSQPTEYEVVWSEVGSEMQSDTSGRISSNSYTIDNLMCCVNYTITVLLYNECGIGSNSSISSITNVGSLSITEADFCSIFPFGLSVDVTGGHIRCPVRELIFSVNGTDLTYPYNPDPTTVYDIVNGSAGEVYYYTVTAIFTETVNVSSDTASVTVSKGFTISSETNQTSIEFQCITSCLRPLSSSYSCKITLDNGATYTALGSFTGNSAIVTITNLNSGTTYYYSASIVFNNVAVYVTDDKSVTTLVSPSPSLTDVAKTAIAVTVSILLSVIIAAVIILLLTYFCYIKKKNSKRSTQDINAEYEVVDKCIINKQSEDVQLQQSPAYGVLNTEN